MYKARIISDYTIDQEDEYVILKIDELADLKNESILKKRFDRYKSQEFDFKTRSMDNYGSLVGYLLNGGLIISENASVVTSEKNQFVMLAPSVQGLSGSPFINQYGKLSGLASSIYHNPEKISEWNDKYLENIRATNIFPINGIIDKLYLIEDKNTQGFINIEEITRKLNKNEYNKEELEELLQYILNEENFLGMVLLSKVTQEKIDGFPANHLAVRTPKSFLKAFVNPSINRLFMDFSTCLSNNDNFREFFMRSIYYHYLFTEKWICISQGLKVCSFENNTHDYLPIKESLYLYYRANAILTDTDMNPLYRRVMHPNFASLFYMAYLDLIDKYDKLTKDRKKILRLTFLYNAIRFHNLAARDQYSIDTCIGSRNIRYSNVIFNREDSLHWKHQPNEIWDSAFNEFFDSNKHFESMISLFMKMESYKHECVEQGKLLDTNERYAQEIRALEEKIKVFLDKYKGYLSPIDANYINALVADIPSSSKKIFQDDIVEKRLIPLLREKGWDPLRGL